MMITWSMLSMSCRKICTDMHYDICEAVYCENHLRLGAGRSCCGKQAFNPAVATCCKVTHGYNITGNDHTFVSNVKIWEC